MKIKISIIAIMIIAMTANSQRKLTLTEVHQKLFLDSNSKKNIENKMKIFKLKSESYKSSFLPNIFTNISLPYQRSISEIIQSNGSQRFIERNFINSSLNFNISQIIPFSGGNLSLTSSINNNRDFNNKTSSFSSNWLNISYQQAINGFNNYKWNKIIVPLEEELETKNFIKEKIKSKYNISKIYFEVYEQQLKIDLNTLNKEKTENYLIELEQKFKLGRVLKIDIDELKISLEQIKSQIVINNLEYLAGINRLKNSLKIQNDTIYKLDSINENKYQIDKIELKKAILKNGFDLSKNIKLFELYSNIEKIKKEGAIVMNLQFGMGLNSASNNFENLYETPAQSQFVTIGTKIPIIDWGKSKRNNEIIKIEKENVKFELKYEERKLMQQIDDLSNYHLSLQYQKSSLDLQLKLSNNTKVMLFELLKLGRKSIVDYKNQIVENFNITIERQKIIHNIYLLKLKIDEITLTL